MRIYVRPNTGELRALRGLTSDEAAILLKIIGALELTGTSALIEQVGHVSAQQGHNPCDLTLTVEGAGATSIAVNRLPLDSIVLDDDGQTVGMIHVWLTDGYLSHMEYDWFTGAPPSAYPGADRVRVASTQPTS